jgi:hypothetical protein
MSAEDISEKQYANNKRKHAQHDGTYVQLQVLHKNSLSFFIYLDDLAHHLDTIQLHMVEEKQVHGIAVMG